MRASSDSGIAGLRGIDPALVATTDGHDALAAAGRLIASLVGVSRGAVNLVGADRQIPLSDTADVPVAMPLGRSVCRHVVATNAPVLIDDAAKDPRVAELPASVAEGIGSYLGVPLRLPDGTVVGAACAIDASPRTWTEHDLAKLTDLAMLMSQALQLRRTTSSTSLHDPVTGLPDTVLFAEYLGEMLERAPARDERVVVIAVDIADFRAIVNAWGHAIGDRVLRQVGQRLADVSGQRGATGELRVCRMVADTFIVAAAVPNAEPRGRIMQQLLSAVVMEPVDVEGEPIEIGVRVAKITAQAGITPPELIEAARLAMNDARRQDGSDPGAEAPAPARRRMKIRALLHGVEDRDELSLAYQPLFALTESPRLVGIEALIRWNSPTLGFVPPDEFIPVAEIAGLIEPIGEWVLRRALDDLATWQAMPGAGELSVSVNVAPEQLLGSTFLPTVRRELANRSIAPASLTLEITERTLGADGGDPALRSALQDAHALGVKLSLDDFGTGFSTLSRLASYPFDELKVDRAFISDLLTAARQRNLVSGIVAMSKALDLHVVAEGIETDEQLRAVRALGCDLAQGYFLARPQHADAIADLLGDLPG